MRLISMLYMTVGSMKDDAGGTDGKQCTVINDAALAWRYLHVVYEGARVAVGVAQNIAQLIVLVAANVHDAMKQIYAWVYRLDGGIDGVAFLIATNGVVAHVKGQFLFVVEHVLNDGQVSQVRWIFGLCGVVFLLLRLVQFRYAYADAELLSALWTLEHQ